MILSSIASLIDFKYIFYDFWELEGDPRIGDRLFFQGGPWTTWSLIAGYIYFVKWLGPGLMKDREPYQLRTPMIVYNFTMILVNAWFFYQIFWVFRFGLDLNLATFVRPDPRDTGPLAMSAVQLGYLFFLSKLVDLIETVFFVLRKKHNQISNLHVYHHSAVPFLVHLSLKVCPVGGPGTLFPLLNTIVHMVMYAYYGLSALGPSVQKYLWWKRYITQIQLIQFIIFSIYSLIFMCFQQDFPIIFTYMGLCQPPLFFYMFWSFYRQSYASRQTKSQQMLKTN